MGHIINLVAQAFILGEKQEMFEQALAKAQRGEDNEQDWQYRDRILSSSSLR
jgi:hypothetical protein